MKTIEELKKARLGDSVTTHCETILITKFEKPSVDVTDAIKRELDGLDWLTRKSARHEYFMSETQRTYSYGNRNTGEEFYDSNPMSPIIKNLMSTLNRRLDVNFSACFLNRYDTEKQHLGWHADDFEAMDPEAPIAVMSFGAEREIWVKPFGESGLVPKEQRILLPEGSLFIMPPHYQETHLHRIPKHGQPCGPRTSLTFRAFK